MTATVSSACRVESSHGPGREKLEKPEEPLTKGAIKELALSLIVLVAKLVIGIPLLQPTRSHTRANILA